MYRPAVASGDEHERISPAIVAAFLANLGIAAAKFLGFAMTGAASMLSEGFHSLADTGNQALLIVGSRRARRAADTHHPFGHGGERYFWGFVVAVVLFTAGGLFALAEGISRLRSPTPLESPRWAIGILVVAIVLESLSLRTARREAIDAKRLDGGTWFDFIRRSKAPELPVVLLEDTGALLGLAFALIGVVIAHVTHNARWDAVGSIAIGLLLFVIAIVLGNEMKSLLIGEAASPRQRQELRNALGGADHVRRIIHLRTMHLGPDELLVAAKVEFDDDLDYAALGAAIDAAEVRIRDAVPAARLIFIEPDVFRSPPTPSTH